ncbi:MAG: CHASE domain-containing protein, partial [Candidatus Binatia bacterium]
FGSSEFVSRDEFRRFVRPLLQRQPGIRALEWIPRVARSEIPRYEQSARDDGVDLHITSMSPTDSDVPAHDRYVYPVFYVEPYQTNAVALGVDLGSNAARREVLERARDSAKPAASRPLVLVQDSADPDGVLVFLPHYDRHPVPDDVAGRRDSLVGFVLAVFRLTDLMAEAMSTLDVGAIRVTILYDGSVVAEYPRAGAREGPSDVANTSVELHRTEIVTMGGLEWEIACAVMPGFQAARSDYLPVVMLTAGLLVTLLLCSHLYVITRRAELQRELEVSERRYRTLVENAPEAVVIFDPEAGAFLDVNDNACRLFKRTRSELLHMEVVSLSAPIQPDGRAAQDAAQDYLKRATDGDTPVFFWIHRDAEGNDIPCEVRLVRLPSSDHTLVRGSVTDITKRVRAEERQALMIRELDHRVKNNLATVVALTQQTAAVSGSVEELRESLVGRIGAIAQVHRALARRKWEGAELSEVLELTFAPYCGSHHTGRVALEGESLTLAPGISSGLCMAFHELATNASKYGALCGNDGRVDVSWSLGETGDLDIEWVETDGPTVIAPSRAGFGSRLLNGIIEYELGGSVNVEYRSSGVRCWIRVPLGARPGEVRL